MSNNESNPVFNMKELGSLQKKVLFFLAENPDKHKQEIQKGINYPAENYGSVVRAVDALKNYGHIKSKEAISKKNLKIKTFSCTDMGLFYTISKNPEADVVRILNAYKDRSKVFHSFRKLYDAWGHNTFAKFLRNLSDFFPIMQKEGTERAISFLLVKSMMDAKALDPKTRKKNAKAAMKQFPNARRLVKEWTDTIKEVL